MERSQTGTVIVVEMDGELVATGSLENGQIFAVFVHPDRQRLGLGKAVMNWLEQEILASGAKDSTLSISLPSRQFYESLGYQVMETCSRDVGDGQHLDYWRARKRLLPVGA